jgi:ABC-type multidrug transport system ATPase subunit
VLEADSVSKRFGARTVLSSASLRARAGVVTALLGRNGVGKTTLLRVLAGIEQPDHGVVRMDGAPMDRASLSELAKRGVFFLPARRLLLPSLTVIDHMRAASVAFNERADLEALAKQLGIAERVGQRPHTLSGGERRRAELAVALARAPRVLIADEPLRGVTPLDAEVLLSALRAYARAGNAVVLTGHELPLLRPFLDRVVWCHAGTTRGFESMHAAESDFAFQREFLAPA